MSLTHLESLEAESIHIMREVVATADNPVILYWKRLSSNASLSNESILSNTIPFPLMHVDATWKFKEMISFRDKIVAAFYFYNINNNIV